MGLVVIIRIVVRIEFSLSNKSNRSSYAMCLVISSMFS